MGQVAQIPCGNCGTLNNASDQFCANCGYSLASGPTGTIPAINNPNAPIVITAGGRRVTGALAPGELLGGRYRNVELVGKGGFGAVYKANDERFQGRRVVAIKEMSDAHLSPQDRVQALKDFRQEADLLVQLRHPNLPDVSDFFEEHGKAYLVMEFIEGKTLEKVQNDANGPLNEQLVMGWALQLCDVLNYLHTQPQPIVFRDLKPSNVMVTKNGQVKLIDFGIARIFTSTAARDTTTLGSRGYAPLEQYGRGQSDARSDIYALGATLYDLLTKTMPTDAPTRRINPPLFENPRRLNPAISIETERIILKAMAEEPRDRYQTSAKMAQAIVASRVLPATSPGRSYAGTLPGYATIPAPSSTQPAPPPTIPANPALSTQAATIPAASVPSTLQTIAATPPPGIYPSYPNLTPPPGQQRISRRALLIGGLVAAGVVVGGGYAAVRFLSSPPPPTGSTIQIPFVYSTEKADWLTAAASSFSNSPLAKLTGSNKTIQVLLNDSGSLDVADKILNGEIKPVAWSPASTLELNRLTYKWKQVNPTPTPPSTIQCTKHSSNPVTLNMYYGSEKEAWISAIVPGFNSRKMTACDGPITVKATPIGSGQSMQEIVDGTIQPDIWSPAGRVWLNLLDSKWFKKYGSHIISTGANDTPPWSTAL
jgi:serine/threonine protein kinase